MNHKACVPFFVFSPNDSPSKTMKKILKEKAIKKVFLFHLKSSFRSQDIEIFVVLPFLSIVPRLKTTNENEIIYDVMS